MGNLRVLVTGASGFVGRALVAELARTNEFEIVAAVRSVDSGFSQKVKVCKTGSLGVDADYRQALEGVDVVVHVAARVHIMNDQAPDSLAEFRRVNVDGTLNLARQAAGAGVKRFVFLSSIKVNGEAGRNTAPFRADDTPKPSDPYGISKHEAEVGLSEISKSTGMEFVIIRPPLVYGPGVKANFYSMMNWLNLGIPLPFGAVHNKRSFVSIDNVVDFIQLCVVHPKAANEIFLISDDYDLSTTSLLQHMGKALGVPVRLLPVPVGIMRVGAFLLGKKGISNRLFDSLQVDIEKTKRLLGWVPISSIDQSLALTAEFFIKERTHE